MKKKFIIVIAVLIAVLAGCASMTVVGIDESSVTGPKQVRQYGDINPRDITIYAFYKDDSRKSYTVRSADIVFDNSRVGPQTVNVKVSGGFTATFETEVMALTGITVASQPAAVKVGASSSWTGLEIQGVWDQMGSEKIDTSKCQITGFNASREGSQTVTVSYNGKQASFNVQVVAMQSIRITSNPAKVSYYQGEPLDLTGLKVAGVYGSGIPDEELTIAASNITGFNTQTIGRQTLTVTSGGRTATFSVEVLDGRGRLNGTWKSLPDDYLQEEWTFNNGSFTYKANNTATGATAQASGTYTIESVNGKVTFTVRDGQKRGNDWISYTIQVDPYIMLAGQIRGTVLQIITTQGSGTSTYQFTYVKQ